MTKISKKRKDALSKYDSTKTYSLKEASSVIKEISNVNFDSSIDLAVRLGVDPRKADQNVRGVVTLPNGTGKDVKVLALVTPDKEKDAFVHASAVKAAGMRYLNEGDKLEFTLEDGPKGPSAVNLKKID